MSYTKELDEYTDEALYRELNRREVEREKGNCSYCLRSFDDKNPCRFHEKVLGVVDNKPPMRIVVERRS